VLLLLACAGTRGPDGGDDGDRPPVAEQPPAPVDSSHTSPSIDLVAVEEQVRLAIDEVRRRHELPSLTPLARLQRLARAHSEDMVERSYFRHTSPDGRTPEDRVRDWGFPAAHVGENIARVPIAEDPAAFAIAAWMQSPAHMDNILSADFSHTGVGVAWREWSDGERELVLTQVFFAYRYDPRIRHD
jgi:uncharacterized protein YkwD